MITMHMVYPLIFAVFMPTSGFIEVGACANGKLLLLL